MYKTPSIPLELLSFYQEKKQEIKIRLDEFKSVLKTKYFYEMCFCICTPQSKAKHAMIVQNYLETLNFLGKNSITEQELAQLLSEKTHYIRFHNQKAKRLIELKTRFNEVEEILHLNISTQEKRNRIASRINGIGYKESSHFLRNIGFTGLAILDRHILKNLVLIGLFTEIPKIHTLSQYLKVEEKFIDFANQVQVPIDELDLLFWAYENGEIIK